MPAKKNELHSSGLKRQRRMPAKFPAISEEMRRWSALLCAELESWPRIESKSMFGFASYYHRSEIFAALPKTRGLYSSSSFLLKFNPMPPALLKRAESDPRMDTNTRMPGQGWFSFQLIAESDLRDALYWLNQAYLVSKKSAVK